MSQLEDLQRLSELYAQGVISQEEYQVRRQALLNQVSTDPAYGLGPAASPAPGGYMTPMPYAAAQPPASGMTPEMKLMIESRANNAFLIEFVGGALFLLLGLGYFYDGRTSDGVVRLIGWWILFGAMWTMIILLSFVLVGLCLIPVGIVAQFGVPLWSASNLKSSMLRQGGLPG